MFLEHFGLREEPFGMTPDPAYLYASPTHREALDLLSLGIEDTRGFLALIAEPGMGKTTLLYRLSEQLRDTTRIVLLSQTQCNAREFVEYVLQELGVDTRGMGLVKMHGQLNEILFEELLEGKRFILILDEAQNLDYPVLETVRMLSNFETHNAKLLQIILAGQPLLASKLSQPRLSQLRQRIAVLTHLEPFSAGETERYIEHRLKTAGHTGDPIFDPAAISAIAEKSAGVPRNINNLCYNSLRLAYARRLRPVTVEIVRQAAASLDMESLVSPASQPLEVVDSEASAATPLADDGLTPPPEMLSAVAAAPVDSIPAPKPVAEIKPRQPSSFLTYEAPRKVRMPKWSARSSLLVAAVLSGIFLLAILGRTESRRHIASASGDASRDALVLGAEANPASPAADYDAAPQDTDNGQVLTVVAGQQQSLKDLCVRYLGRFDGDLAAHVMSLNPDLKDPDHLVPGHLIRIPLPPGAMKKVNDTADADSPGHPASPSSLFGRLSELLRERK